MGQAAHQTQTASQAGEVAEAGHTLSQPEQDMKVGHN